MDLPLWPRPSAQTTPEYSILNPETEMTLPLINGVRDIADQYDALILDLWGVVHNGVAPYPGVLDCMAKLHEAGKKVVLLSNAPRQSEKVEVQVAGFGVPRAAYDVLVTSGDVTRLHVERRDDDWHAALGQRYLHVGPERDYGLLHGTGVDEVSDLADADFILTSGLWNDDVDTEADYDELFGQARARNLPMICANPDLSVMRGDQMVLCAGSIAAHYEAMGGEVRYNGKPYAPGYELCFERLGGISRGRVIGVGDSFRTDIAGANLVGIDSLFVLSGIHAEELGGDNPDASLIEAAATKAGHMPTAAIGGFYW
jgi:HAD superfamily hydrolase (TIGR01459 family)